MCCSLARLALGLLALSSLFHARLAAAGCRTDTCKLPPNFQPADDDGGCSVVPVGGACMLPDGGSYTNLPVYWSSACVGYYVQENASQYVALSDFENAASGAFETWMDASCPNGNPVGIAVNYLGPISNEDAGYAAGAENPHEIVFRDDGWPYEDVGAGSATVALTTVTFDVATGEIVDAVIEINTTDHVVVVAGAQPPPDSGLPPSDGGLPANAFDLQSVLTHETGHFLGLAHTPDTQAVMYATRDQGVSGLLRALVPDDVQTICSIYPGDGTRSVGTLVSASGSIPAQACNPGPVHHDCGCGVVGGDEPPSRTLLASAGLSGAMLLLWAGRRRSRSLRA